MKRLLALIIAIFMVAACCGCRDTVEENSVISWYEGEDGTAATGTGNGETGEKTSDGKTNKPSKSKDSGDTALTGNTNIENPLKANLKGATINVYTVSDAFNPDASASKTAKAQAKLLEKIQKSLNCKIQAKVTTSDKLKSSVATSAAAGKALCQVIDPKMYTAGYYVASGLVTDLARVSSMDMSKSYMQRYGVAEASRVKKSIYAVSSEGYNRVFLTYFNKRILKELGYSEDHLYKLVDSGKWTLSALDELSKQGVKDLDGKPGHTDADQHGVMYIDYETGLSACTFANTNTFMVTHDANGNLVYNMENPAIMNIATTLQSVCQNGSAFDAGEWQAKVSTFASGKSFLLVGPATNMGMLSNMKDDFGVIPVPKFSEASKDYTAAVDLNCEVLMMPAGLSAKDQANAGAFIQAYEYLLDDVIDASANEFANRYFRDDESLKYFKLAQKQMLTDPSAFYGYVDDTLLAGTYRVIWNYFNPNLNTPMAAAIESAKSACTKIIGDVNAAVK